MVASVSLTQRVLALITVVSCIQNQVVVGFVSHSHSNVAASYTPRPTAHQTKPTLILAAEGTESDGNDPKEKSEVQPKEGEEQASRNTTTTASATTYSALATTEDKSFVDGLKDNLQMRLRIAQESNKEGNSVTQTVANVLAGDYEQETTRAQIEETVKSAPCVMLTWERSPSCAKAVEAFQAMGIFNQIKVVRLDDPWDKGNPLRAEIGKQVGRSSVPMIFIGGEYVGGFDGGVSDKAPGIQTMAFKGTLRPALEAAGIQL